MQPAYKSKYEWYLASEDFDKIRQSVFQRDGFKCVACGSTEKIVPHHLTYQNIYHENLRDLVTLCSRCHTIYHTIQNLEFSVTEHYAREDQECMNQRKQEIEKVQEEHRAQQEYYKKLGQLFVKRVFVRYQDRDYAKNGDLDMMSWSTLNPIIDHELEYFNSNFRDPRTPRPLEDYDFKKTDIQNAFLQKRLELLLRSMEKGISFQTMIKKTKFDPSWLRKWYDRNRIEAKLNELSMISKIKGGNES